MGDMSVEQTCIDMGDPLDIGEEPIRYLSEDILFNALLAGRAGTEGQP